jgi:uncharacterized protein YabE (DUF348 family)
VSSTRPPPLPRCADRCRSPPGVALTALLAGGAVWTTTDKTVQLSVDGSPRSVDFRGSTVDDVLAAAGLDTGERDLVVPALDEPVQDGDRVAVRRARPMTLVVDGEAREVWVTAASVDEALDQVGLREPGLALSASRSRELPLDGFRLDVRTPQDVVVLVDGAERPVTSSAATVRELLSGAGIALGPQDRLSKYPTEAFADGERIRVVRVATTRGTRDVEVPFGTERREDATALTGTSTTLRAGTPGVVEQTVETVTADGAVERSTVVAQRTLSEPVGRVVAVGTKPKPAPAPRPAAAAGGGDGPTSGGGLNWAALAACESGGNPARSAPPASTGASTSSRRPPGPAWAAPATRRRPAPASRPSGPRCCTRAPGPASGRPAAGGSARQDRCRPRDC